MSLLQRLAGWITGDPILLKAAAAEEDDDDKECTYVNLTGDTLHFCREIGIEGRYEAYMTLETQGPVPTVRSVFNAADGTHETRAGSIKVYFQSHYETTVIDNLRERQPGVTLVVPEQVLDESEHLMEYNGRHDLVCAVPISHTRVDGGIEGEVYCIGVRMQNTY